MADTNELMFSDWLKAELDARGWKQSELARRSGIGTGYISQLANGVRRPGAGTCRSIARAFNLPQDEVLRRAGLLNPTWQQAAKEDLTIGQIVELVRQMDVAERGELYEYALYRMSRPKHDGGETGAGKAKPLRSKPAGE